MEQQVSKNSANRKPLASIRAQSQQSTQPRQLALLLRRWRNLPRLRGNDKRTFSVERQVSKNSANRKPLASIRAQSQQSTQPRQLALLLRRWRNLPRLRGNDKRTFSVERQVSKNSANRKPLASIRAQSQQSTQPRQLALLLRRWRNLPRLRGNDKRTFSVERQVSKNSANRKPLASIRAQSQQSTQPRQLALLLRRWRNLPRVARER